MEGENSNTATESQSPLTGDRIKLNVGGKLFETTTSTLLSGGPDSLLSVLSNRPLHSSDHSQPLFIDRDPEIFSVLLSLLRSNRLPSTAKRFSNQELIDEAIYYGIESQLKSALAPSSLTGIDASLFTTIRPASDGVVSDFNAIDSDDGSVWLAHGGQISFYDWNLTHFGTVRTHLDYINTIRRIGPGLAAVGSESQAGLHIYNIANGYRVSSVEWVDPSDPRIYKARVNAIADSDDWVFATFDCQHKENCVQMIDKNTMKAIQIARQPGNSSKSLVAGKLTYVPERGVLFGVSVMSGAFGYSGYIRLWDPRTKDVVWETNEPGSGRSSRFGDSFADVDVDLDELSLVKLCSKSGDLAVADLRKLSEDPWVYLKEKNPSMRTSQGGGNCVIHCYRRQVFVGREGELEVWSRVEEEGNENVEEGERILCERSYRRNYVDKVEDSERGVIKKIEGGGDRLFVTREDVEGIEVWQSSQFSGAISLS